jgi:hypothetical protein
MSKYRLLLPLDSSLSRSLTGSFCAFEEAEVFLVPISSFVVEQQILLLVTNRATKEQQKFDKNKQNERKDT